MTERFYNVVHYSSITTNTFFNNKLVSKVPKVYYSLNLYSFISRIYKVFRRWYILLNYNYINIDGIILPEYTQIQPNDPRYEYPSALDEEDREEGTVVEDNTNKNNKTTESKSSENEEQSETSSNSSWKNKTYTFPELELQLLSAIQELDGNVFIKGNWTAAKDSDWMMGTLQCTTPGHIYMLMKSSTQLISDYFDPFQYTSDPSYQLPQPTLVLRKWYNINHATEFRLFIKDKHLIGVSQRYCSTFYSFLNTDKELYINLITSFFNKVIMPNYDEDDNYTVDIYVENNKKVWIIDFGVFGENIVDLCLFEWEELNNNNDYKLIYKVVEVESGIIPSDKMFYQLPLELQNIGDNGLDDYLCELRDKMKKDNLL